ncbi:methyltransferase domain-containing protein [Hymenobacter wooponensis]|uniref:Methyltransferase domain-containing protein n=1 Tax=Hymenobacter wooponensis TaxID=1525360 RepID=A0A4Z0MUQ0_9BACT|nr:methyltransferase domain-containing protein [Hymenobacter wooponensis]TGD83038.1 methyltransferase domain-containing protein [Hymenobacter wooponensis]
MLTTKQKADLGILFKIPNEIRLAYLRLKFAGDKVICPCCQSTFREFAPFSIWKKPNSWCVQCESLERHRALWMYLETKTDIYSKPLKLLHVAPEDMFFKRFEKEPNIEYYPADILPYLYRKGTKYLDLLSPDIPDNTFDVIICNHVFAYIEDDKTAMHNVYKMLKPGGWGILQVALDPTKAVTHEDLTITDPKERERIFGLNDHVRLYGLDYADKLKEAGFDVLIDDYTAEFSDEEIFKYGFWKGDPFYVVSKK